MSLPCKDCICLAICRSKYMECIHETDGNTFLARSIVKQGCDLLAQYLYYDNDITQSFEHKTSMFRMYMLGDIL